MKKLLILLFFLFGFNSNAQRTMFTGQNNYVAPPFVFVNIPTGANPVTTELKMYLDGFLSEIILPIYSKVKKIVIIHSITASSVPYK